MVDIILYAIDSVYKDYAPGTRIRKGALVIAIFHKITTNTSVVMTPSIQDQIHQSIHEQIALGNLVDIRGLNGGICLGNTVVNDHICPTCGNDRVSKNENSCWKCGNSLT
jgi:hypothetical protein